MPLMSHPVVEQLLVPFIVLFLFVFGIIGFAVGVGLVLNGALMHRFFGVMNRSVSTRRGMKWIAVPRDIQPAVQRYRRPIGGIFILGAAFSIFGLVTRIDVDRGFPMLGIEAQWVIESMRWFLIGGNLVAIAIGIMLVFFPDALRAIETRANRWYSFRHFAAGGESMNMAFDSWVERFPRIAGCIIAAAALVLVVNSGILLFAHG
jgi:hypothetical protein